MQSITDGKEIPLVTVALPIYNEEKYIGETLEALIHQDYQGLELVIADNGSTDNTGAICLQYAEKNKIIKYIRHPENIGVAANHTYLLNEACGKYFMFAAGHDKWSASLVSECVDLLEKHETATIAFGTPVWIDEHGNFLHKFSGWYDSRGLSAAARFFMVFWGGMNPVLGVIRRKAMPVWQNYNFVGADLVILGELALKGEFIHATGATFYRRRNRPAENYDEKSKRYKSKETQLCSNLFFKIFPLAKLPFELLRIVLRAQIGILEKIIIVAMLIPALPARYILGKKDHCFAKKAAREGCNSNLK